MKASATAKFTFPESDNNGKLLLTGNMVFRENISGQIDLVLEGSKCSFDMKTCERNPTINVQDICKKFDLKTSFYSSLFASYKPPFKCPVQSGNYTMENTEIDLAFFSWLLEEGHFYSGTVKLIENETRTKKKRVVICFYTGIKVVKTRLKSRSFKAFI
jgi:hypothetical protein